MPATTHPPLAELYDDPTNAVNVLVNCSFELTNEDGLVGWSTLSGEAEQASREGGGHAVKLTGRIRSNRFEASARLRYEWTGEAKGRVTGQIHFCEHDRYLRTETFEHFSEDWQPFCWSFLPPPNSERAECELEADGALIDNLYLDGLGAAPFDILDNQAGYHPDSSKRVIVRAKSELAEAVRWELLDTLTGQTFADGELESTGEDIWKRWTYVADISSCEREGYYLLRIYLPGNTLESAPIRIWSDVYHHLAQTVATYSYLQRCGIDIPGYHKACHVNDAMFRFREEQEGYGEPDDPHGQDSTAYREVKGGWHDAGDYNKWYHYYGYVEETLALMHYRMELPRSTYGGDLPDVLSEVFWGADFFLKVQNHDGSFTGPICAYYTHEDEETHEKRNSSWAVFWEQPHQDSGAGVVGHPRTRTFDYVGHHPSPGLALDLANALAAAARCAKDVDDARCLTYVTAALKSADYASEAGTDPSDPYWFSLWYGLYKATGDETYRARALEVAQLLLERNLNTDSLSVYSALKGSFRHLNVLLELLIDEPDNPLRAEILTAADRQLGMLDNHTLHTPYNLRLMPVKGREPDELAEHTMGRNAWIGSVAYTYALAGKLAGNREWLRTAEEQIAWILGRNPHGVCMIVDGGRVHPGRYHGWTNMNSNDLCGAITGGVVNGIMPPKDTPDTEHPWTVQPPRFPILSVRRLDVPYSDHDLMNARHDTNEYWSLHHGGFQEAVSALSAAYADMAIRPKACLLFSNSSGYHEASEYDDLFETHGWNADRMNSDASFPQVNPHSYDAFVVGRTWVGSEWNDPEAFGIHVRWSWELGVPWILLEPESDAGLQWLETTTQGLLPDGETKELARGGWEDDEFGRVRRIGESNVHLVADETVLGILLARYEPDVPRAAEKG